MAHLGTHGMLISLHGILHRMCGMRILHWVHTGLLPLLHNALLRVRRHALCISWLASEGIRHLRILLLRRSRTLQKG
jgi:hypothetical protein